MKSVDSSYRTTFEMIRVLRAVDKPDENIVKRLGLESAEESAVEEICTVTGQEATEVLLVIECLRHFGYVHMVATGEITFGSRQINRNGGEEDGK